MLRGIRTWRWLRVVVEHLPPESATKTAMRNALGDDELERLAAGAKPETGRWSQLEQLVASLVDSSRSLEHILVLANSDGKGRKPQPPAPVRRPGGRPPAPTRQPMTAEAAEVLFRLTRAAA